MKLTKYDVLLYIETNKGGRESLARTIRGDIRFEGVSYMSVNSKVRELKKEKLITEDNTGITINRNNKKTDDLLAFLHWARMKNRDYNLLMNRNFVSVFKGVLGGAKTLKDLSQKTGLSRPTLLKIIRELSRNRFIRIERKKPLMLEANLNDLTFFYINLHEFPLRSFERGFNIPKIPQVHSKKLTEKLIKLHTYSTTVTEGNTATQEDIDRIFGDYPVDLTPREITEILNAKKAIELLYEIREEGIGKERISDIHRTLMFNLVDGPGDFYYGRKRIIGSQLKPPQSADEIGSAMNALVKFIARYEDETDPLIIGTIAHFIFVTIHPFSDGNGRVGRLLHSWIHLRGNLPLFVFDPDKRNRYFNALEEGREESIDAFVDFCLEGMVEYTYMD